MNKIASFAMLVRPRGTQAQRVTPMCSRKRERVAPIYIPALDIAKPAGRLVSRSEEPVMPELIAAVSGDPLHIYIPDNRRE